jgi:cytochrome c oxidase subunit IV
VSGERAPAAPTAPVRPRTYALVFAALLALLAATVGAAFLDLGALDLPVALTIAALKTFLVVAWFMHVARASRLVWVVALAGFWWLGHLVVLALADYVSR